MNDLGYIYKWVFGLIGIVALCLAILVITQCAAFQESKPTIDINVLEGACVAVSSTRVQSRDCRNAVRQAWASTYGIDAGWLEGGSVKESAEEMKDAGTQ